MPLSFLHRFSHSHWNRLPNNKSPKNNWPDTFCILNFIFISIIYLLIIHIHNYTYFTIHWFIEKFINISQYSVVKYIHLKHLYSVKNSKGSEWKIKCSDCILPQHFKNGSEDPEPAGDARPLKRRKPPSQRLHQQPNKKKRQSTGKEIKDMRTQQKEGSVMWHSRDDTFYNKA